ncbi:MAG TPA: crosslink repair DNA glycosylase YcaQ family protein [Lachnospiraceae bacterium]|nr:crosslink repair DNA glycosylase YcaQ family protein [Lachnospiraceae bacterium]
MNTYSKEEARSALIRYQNLDGNEDLVGLDGVRTIMERIGTIQYDPLNVVGHNPDLVLQARVREYKPEYLNQLLYKEHSLVDGTDKEMCIYNTMDFGRFARVREAYSKSALATLAYRGQLGALEILEEVKAFVSEHGITGTKDITIGDVRESRWGHKKLSSAALDYLYNAGELCVANKRGTQKYFDLTNRVIPSQYDEADSMTLDEFLDWYVARRIRCVGFLWDKNGGAWQGQFLSEKKLRRDVLNRLLEQNKIYSFQIEGLNNEFYACRDFQSVFDGRIRKNYARFLAPLDNIMWDRTMLQSIFDFSYRWEVYTPVIKRKYGYYVIPVLYHNRFVARFEPEPVGTAHCFRIKNWWWEPGITPDELMKMAILDEMKCFSGYLGVECVEPDQDVLVQK